MDQLVYKHEKTLGTIALVISIIVWLLLIVGTLGIGLIYILFGFIFYLFVQSGFIAYIKGTAVKLTPQQFPDLHQRFVTCCRKLGMANIPEAYLLHGDGMFNAFATRFLGRNFVILLSDVVDTMQAQPDAINFYIGHELGHIRMKHLTGGVLRMPASILPLLGAGYSRAKEYTCDRHGRACCDSSESSARGLAALAAGKERWQTLDLAQYAQQDRQTGGFWMSYHELTGDYPWLTKRIRSVMPGDGVKFPSRNIFAWILATITPRFGGRTGGAGGLIMLVAIIGILAAIAIPAYRDYMQRAKVASVIMPFAKDITMRVGNHYQKNEGLPASLEAVGVKTESYPAELLAVDMNSEDGTLTFTRKDGKQLAFVPSVATDGAITWVCKSIDIPTGQLPQECK